MPEIRLQLTQKDVRILVQSLSNCLATCKVHGQKPDAPCEDCDAARALQARIQEQVAKG